jgi:hypothetical protein
MSTNLLTDLTIANARAGAMREKRNGLGDVCRQAATAIETVTRKWQLPAEIGNLAISIRSGLAQFDPAYDRTGPEDELRAYKSVLTWIPARSLLPDDEVTVMLALRGADTPIPGFHDGDRWKRANGVPIQHGEVYAWSDVPEMPAEGPV